MRHPSSAIRQEMLVQRFRSMVLSLTIMTVGASRAASQTTYDACYVPTVGAIYLIKQAGLPSACLAQAHVLFSWTSGGVIADGSVTTAMLADGAVTPAKLSFNPATQTELNALAVAGTINTSTNPVDWTQLKNVPAGFADGADDGGAASDHGALTGLTDDDHSQYLLTDGVRNSTNGFAVTGTSGTGAIPVAGVGVRLMWYPRKAAFRAGAAFGTAWDDANIGLTSIALGATPIARGDYSIALGGAAIAGGVYSTAIGASTNASGDSAMAIGIGTTASGPSSMALGWRTTASGPWSLATGALTVAFGPFSTAMGQSTYADGSHTTALGFGTLARGDQAIATGRKSRALGISSTAMGDSTTASGQSSSAFGRHTTASGNGATAMGFESVASGDTSVAIGTHALASGFSAAAFGYWTNATGPSSTAMGVGSQAVGSGSMAMNSNTGAFGAYSTAMGFTSAAVGVASTAMGWDSHAEAYASLAIGRFNVISGTANSWIATDHLLVAGNGSSSAATSNALTLLKNGNMTIAGTLTQSSDIRFKEGIRTMDRVLDGVLDLRPIYYRFREGTGHPTDEQIGLAAQEVEQIFPQLVHRDSEGKLSVAYTQLAAVLVRAVQEQQATIQALRAELAALRAAVEASAQHK